MFILVVILKLIIRIVKGEKDSHAVRPAGSILYTFRINPTCDSEAVTTSSA